MAKRADDRFQNAREMMTALERVVDQIKRASEASEARGFLRLPASLAIGPSRHRKAALGLSGLAVLVAAVAWGLLATSPREAPGPREASTSAAIVGPGAAASVESPRAEIAAQGAPAAGDESGELAEVDAIELAPGERELATAAQQIARRRLTQPPGDNAFDSLRAAQRLAPQVPLLARTGQRWLETATPYLSASLAEGRDDGAHGLYVRAKTLADELQLRDSAAWNALESVAIDAFATRLRAALTQGDVTALRRAKAAATSWGLAPGRLEPHWSQTIVRASIGDPLRSGATAMVLARMPAGARPGLAVLPAAVTRREYAAFVAATGHAGARCRIRTARMTLKRRTWERPGFAQTGEHPVVCVSAADAMAYAAWLGQRDGQRYRLPQSDEWRALALANAPVVCRGRCEGTAPVGASAPVAGGIRSHAGSVREWSAECRAGCQRRVSLGSGWRDAGSAMRGADAVEGAEGYDDVGFRLVREVGAAELEAR